ncbi:InlB B-repeat-containing protein, partial [Eubacterium callanderi]|uniref:InlB B-repeat-containing protein n=1 Tax=Eubacterium callanderi TaxID=53442 RepID=UPI0026734B36
TVPLYAQWRANKYSIQFDGNTADGGSMADQTMTYDEAASLASNSYTKTGYTFTGWNTQADGSGTAYGDGENVKNLTTVDGETVPLYAQWRANKYSIQFEGNTADGGSMADQAMTYDEAASLERNSYTKTGYTFTGWNTQADGGGTAYGDGEEVKNLTIVDGEVVKLYAQWRLRTPSIVTSQSIGKHGDTITLTGEDFEPNAEVIFTLHSMPKEIGKAPADTDGKVTLTFQVPFDTEEGDHQLRADNGIHSAQTGLKVLKTAKADSEKIDNNTNGTPVGTGIQSHGYIPLVLVLVLCGITFGVLLRRNKLK